jgi:hypothetical protein
MNMNEFIDRVIRAVRLDAVLYTEVKTDNEALRQALVVVALSGLASGVGNAKGWIGYLIIMFFAFTLWLGWSFVAYLVGTRLLSEPQTKKDYLGLLRATGFAYSPHILQIFAAIPGLMLFVTVATTIWTLIAVVIAVRQAFDYTNTFRAIWVVLISIVAQAVIILFLTFVIGGDGGAQ